MKKLLQHVKTGRIELVEVPAPTPRPGFVIVKTAFSAISRGTELALVELLKTSLVEKARRRPQDVRKVINMVRRYGIKTTYSLIKDKLDSYVPLGYSLAGEVLMADEASEFQKGDFVACGGSEYASHQEIASVPVNMCVKIPEGVGLDEAAFTTIGSVAIWALREADMRFGEKGLVVGLGLLGMLAYLIMDASGSLAWGTDIDDKKVSFASRIGVRATSLNELKERDFDYVIVAASSKDPAPLEYALNKVRKRGRIVILGAVPVNLDRNAMYEKEVKISVSRSYGPGRYDPYYELLGYTCPLEYLRWNVKENMKTFLELLASGKINVKNVITHRFDFNRAPEAYETLKDKNVVGAIFVYPGNVTYRKNGYVQKSPIAKGKIRVSVIGAGTFLRNFILPHMKKMKDIRFDTVCNERPESGYNVLKKFSFSSFTAEPDVVLNGDADLVVIGTRHDTHGELVKKALLRGKSVYVEKPLAIYLDDVYDIRKIIEDKGGFLHVGFNRRFADGLLRVKSFLRTTEPLSGFIRVIAGKLPSTHWAKIGEIGGDRIVGEVCHFIDVAVFLSESKVRSVYASSIKEGSDFDDNLHIQLKMENGGVITILYTEWGADILGKEYYEFHQNERSVMLHDFKTLVIKGDKNVNLKVKGKGHENEVKALIEGMKHGNPPIPLDEIFNVTFTTFAIRKSLREGREVFLREF